MEIWKPIPSLENFYEASSLGQIRRAKPGRNTEIGKIITQRKKKGTDYLRCRVTFHNKSTDHSVHRLVCEAFHGPSNGREVDHLNNLRYDNRPENLEWVSRQENTQRMYDRGYVIVRTPRARENARMGQLTRKPDTWCRGENHPSASITEEKAKEIIEKLKDQNISMAKVARDCGVKYNIVTALKYNFTWKHLPRF